MSKDEGGELRTGYGSSDKNVTEAVHEAIHDALRSEEPDVHFDVTLQAVTKHHSPWHITYNAIVRERSGP